MPGYFLNSNILFCQARKAYLRTKGAPSEDAGQQDDALSAILFSAAALEAWIAELGLLTRMTVLPTSPTLAALGQAIEDIENSRGSVRLKYHIAMTLLTGKGYDRGAQPYQDFDLLFSLRDALVHMKPEKIAEPASERTRTERLVKRLSSVAACVPQEKPGVSSWLSKMNTRSVARWACNTAKSVQDSVRGAAQAHLGSVDAFSVLMGPFSSLEPPG